MRALRLAVQRVNIEAASKADEAFAKDHTVHSLHKGGPLNPKMDCDSDSAHKRKIWMDHYTQSGGDVRVVCGVRVALLAPEPAVAQIVDRVFSSRHPELGGRTLSFDNADGSLRIEWMDLYEEYGGRVAKVCQPHTC